MWLDILNLFKKDYMMKRTKDDTISLMVLNKHTFHELMKFQDSNMDNRFNPTYIATCGGICIIIILIIKLIKIWQ